MITVSYSEEVRKDVIAVVQDLKKDNPKKYQLVVDEIVDLIRGAKLVDPAGPDEE